MPTLESIARELDTPDSEYVNAAKNGGIETIRSFLQDASKREMYTEHGNALSEAVAADDLEITTLILKHVNQQPEKSINPFHDADITGSILNNALRNASHPIVMLLLQQKQIQNYLKSNSDQSEYTLKFVSEGLHTSKRSPRGLFSLLRIANRNSEEPVISENLKDFTTRYMNTVNGYRMLCFSAHKGLKIGTAEPNKSITLRYMNTMNGSRMRLKVKTTKQNKLISLPSIPPEITKKIYSYLYDESTVDLDAMIPARIRAKP